MICKGFLLKMISIILTLFLLALTEVPVSAQTIPKVISVSPNAGPPSGGTPIVIFGTGFVDGAKVYIGDYAAINVSWIDSTLFTAITPANTPGFKTVAVVNPDGYENVLGSGFKYIDNSHVPVRLVPSVYSVGIGQIFSLEIKTNSIDTQKVSGASIFVNFDATKLEVIDADSTTVGIQISSGKMLPDVLINSVDNVAGTIDYSAGKLGEPYPMGSFAIATINFKAKEISGATSITFSFSDIRQTLVEYAGTIIEGEHEDANIVIVASTSVNVRVQFQGSSRPNHLVSVNIKFFSTGSNVLIDTPIYSFLISMWSKSIIPKCSDISLGNYDISVVSAHTLINVKRNVAINDNVEKTILLDFLLEGNSNNDDRVNIQDFGLLAASYGKLASDPLYNVMTDFDCNGRVNIQDFGLLSSNYMKISPIEVP